MSKSTSRWSASASALIREFLFQQTPLIVTILLLATACSLVQQRLLSSDIVLPSLEQRQSSIFGPIWMGIWTGYTLALVGQAAGLFALPYCTGVLGFNSVAVSPTIQLMTLVNPLGALLGLRSSDEWRLTDSLWLCLGACVGGMVGPFIRIGAFNDAARFDQFLGICLVAVGCQLLREAVGNLRTVVDCPASQLLPSKKAMFAIGATVGSLSVALGVGGGFLLVPILGVYYRLSLRLISSVTIPYTIALSAVGLAGYLALLPLMGLPPVHPDLAWGLYAGAGGILGSWCAVKTQHLYPERFLRVLLGMVLTLLGLERAL